LAPLYNSSYTPQLGDTVVYARVGHEATLAKQVLLPRSNGPRRELPPFLACVVAKVEYIWSVDALLPPGKLAAANANPYARLPLTAAGDVDTRALLRMERPIVFARVTLVPLADAHLIRNANHPLALVQEQDDTGRDASPFSSSSPPLGEDALSLFDTSALPPAERWFEVVARVDTRIRLRRVVKPGEEWAPRVKVENHATSASAAEMNGDAGVVKEEPSSGTKEEFAMVGGRRKRSLRGQAHADAESSPSPSPPPSASSVPGASNLPVRQSLRNAVQQSLHDAPSAAHDAPASAAAAAPSTRTRIVLRRGAGGHHVAMEASTPAIKSEEGEGGAPTAAAAALSSSSSSWQAEDDHALALKLSQQAQPRSSARQRVPKKQDPYEAQLLTQPPQYAPGRVRGGGAAAAASSSTHLLGDGLSLPASSFVVDLFEPQDADWLVLASRVRACGNMAHWVATSAEVDHALLGTEAAKRDPSRFLTPLPQESGVAAGDALAAAAAASAAPPREWVAGDRFKMKFSDQSEWSTGVILGNALHDHEREHALLAAAAARVTRHQLKAAQGPSPSTAATVTPWACLRVSWKSEEEIEAMLDEQASARAASLVAEPSLPAAANGDPAAARAHLRLHLLSQLEAEDFVSPWEIDRLERPQGEMEGVATMVASMDSRVDEEQVTDSGAVTRLAGPGRVIKSELLHLAQPDALLDLSEHLTPSLTARLLHVVEDVLADEAFAPFVARVRARSFPNYPHVVPYALSLRTLRRRLRQRFYRTLAALADDVRALSVAARRYNAPGSAIVELAGDLERRLMLALFAVAPRDFSVLITPSGPETGMDWRDADLRAQCEGVEEAIHSLRGGGRGAEMPATAAQQDADSSAERAQIADAAVVPGPAPMELDDAS